MSRSGDRHHDLSAYRRIDARLQLPQLASLADDTPADHRNDGGYVSIAEGESLLNFGLGRWNRL